MRDYGRVHHTFWSSKTTGPLPGPAKLLALYVMTCAHNTIAGVFRLPDGYIAEDTGWNMETVSQGFSELFRNGFAERCPETKWVWIVKHLDWNPPENPNQWKAAAKVWNAIPELCVWRPRFFASETVRKQLNNSPVPVPVPVVGGVGEKKTRKRRGEETPLPENFTLSDRVLKWASQQGLAGVIELHFEAFVSTCKAKGYRYVDWDEAFMGAVRKNWAGIKTPAAAGKLKVAI